MGVQDNEVDRRGRITDTPWPPAVILPRGSFATERKASFRFPVEALEHFLFAAVFRMASGI
jgi:hypothetical protein